MSATANFIKVPLMYDPSEHKTWRDWIDPKFNIGTILTWIFMALAAMWAVYGTVDQNLRDNSAILTKLDAIQQEQERVRLALPMTTKDLQDLVARTASLEQNFNALRDRTAQDEQTLALEKQQLDNMQEELHELYLQRTQSLTRPH